MNNELYTIPGSSSEVVDVNKHGEVNKLNIFLQRGNFKESNSRLQYQMSEYFFQIFRQITLKCRQGKYSLDKSR